FRVVPCPELSQLNTLSLHDALPIFVIKGDHTANVHAKVFNFFARLTAYIDKNVLQRRWFLLVGITHVDRGPTEYAFHDTLLALDVYAFRRSDLVVGASIASDVYVAVVRDIINKPGNLVGMGLDNYLILAFGVDHANGSAIDVDDLIVDIRFEIVQPDLLTCNFKTSRGCIVEIVKKKLPAFLVHSVV